MNKRSFASDNYAGVHPKVLRAIEEANVGHTQAYGGDPYTQKAIELFKRHFGEKSDVYFVCNGTAANVLSLSALVKPYQSIICADSAHIHVDECGATEKYVGCKLLPIPSEDGKLTIQAIEQELAVIGDQHKVQPKVISITQTTEWGTVYTLDEIKKICTWAHKHNLYVHMDGARLSNAAASLNVSLTALTRDAGVDLVTFGGTKNGMMMGEAVIFFNKELSKDFQYIRKQGMQLISKMRFISAQFMRLLTDDLWLSNARHANAMAKMLGDELGKISHVKIVKAIEANVVFARVEPKLIAKLQGQYQFYVWNEKRSEVRWMTAWDTTKEDVLAFVELIRRAPSR